MAFKTSPSHSSSFMGDDDQLELHFIQVAQFCRNQGMSYWTMMDYVSAMWFHDDPSNACQVGHPFDFLSRDEGEEHEKDRLVDIFARVEDLRKRGGG